MIELEYCPRCGMCLLVDWKFDVNGRSYEYKYCPRCGWDERWVEATKEGR